MPGSAREPIAVIGLGLRTAGAATQDEFWRLLCEGQDVMREAPANRWSVERLSHQRGGFVDGIDQFDWRAFRIPPHEAEQLDPQQRLLLEAAWESLEDACLPLHEMRGARAGVFVGMNPLDFQRLLARDWSRLDGYAVLGTTAALAANRISHTFGLVGPSLVLNMACASSLAAIHYACQSLWSRETDLALAGGVELMLSPDSSIMLAEAGMLSTSGRQRALDTQADGYVRGEGAGVVVLRRLSDVQRGERVYALVRGSALNHNGPGTWVTDPSSQAQADVFLAACTSAAIRPGEVDYVELHGAALPKGDRAEIMAVGAAASDGRAHPCRIGTLTNNIGYLGAAGGLAAAIKVALSLHHRVLPPTINLNAPLSDLADLGLQAQVDLEPWPGTSPTPFAGVLSTSLGGANACVVLCGVASNEQDATTERDGKSRGLHVLPLSGHTAHALRAQVKRYARFLAELDDSVTPVQDVCYTASVRRTHHRNRLAVVGDSRQALLSRLEVEGDPSASYLAAAGAAATSSHAMPRIVLVYVPWSAQAEHCVRRLGETWLPLRAAASGEAAGPAALVRLLATCGIQPDSSASIDRGDQLSTLYAEFDDQRHTCLIVIGARNGFPSDPFRISDPVRVAGASVLYTFDTDESGEQTFLQTLVALYTAGYDVNWSGLFPRGGRCADLPAYAFQRQRFWPEWLSVTEVSTSPAGAPAAEVGSSDIRRQLLAAAPLARSALVGRYLSACVADVLPIDPGVALSADTRWFDLGLTSLVLIQLARRLERDLGVTVPVGDFFEWPTLDHLGRSLLAQMFEAPAGTLTTVRARGDAPRRDVSELDSRIDQMSESEAAALLRQRVSALRDLG